ncbi:hypothetical protein Cni_G20740 [Canna indica]|uniref:DUF7036 domain-containing protein n=1 Tax=Canna indica TaxID=4628 RepID=A0AAQ3QGJ8_9LILI|nr:hypothetical protein Cni_G20740 [Canna indica]
MGKAGKDFRESALPVLSSAEDETGGGCPRLRYVGRIVRPRCVVALVLGAAMLLSVIFWLPPFLRHYNGHKTHGRDPNVSAEVIASFKLQKPVALLNSNIVKLQLDIFEEIGVPNTSISIISMEPYGVTNWTSVIFGIWPYPKTSTIPSTGLSILRSSFMDLVVGHTTIGLTTSLFGNSSFFEVIKFPGGITIIPPQKVFLLQKEQMLFNFTLNFPIYQVERRIIELKNQMKFGLLLKSNENLYIKLTNLEGSTIFPPTVVQTSIVLAVGNHQPSLPRLKQLAKNIRNSSEGNLGLNHTVFGRVKQIRLSSFLQHSLTSGGTNGSPSPAPQPHHEHHVPHSHPHHHHHSHHYSTDVVPPALPPLQSNHQSGTPNGCPYGFSRKPKTKDYLTPDAAPVPTKEQSAAPEAASKHFAAHAGASPRSAPSSAPRHLLAPITPRLVLPESPSPAVLSSHSQSNTGVTDNKPPDKAPSSSSTPGKYFLNWVLALLIILVSL